LGSSSARAFVFSAYLSHPVDMDDYGSLWNTSWQHREQGEISWSVKAFFADRRPVAGVLLELVVGPMNSVSDFLYLRLITFAGFAGFFWIVLPVMYGRSMFYAVAAFLLIVSSGAFVTNVNWALYYINALCYLTVAIGFWFFCRSEHGAARPLLARFLAVVFLTVAVLMFQSTWLLFPILVLLMGLAHPDVFFTRRAILAGAAIFTVSLVLGTLIAGIIEHLRPDYFIDPALRNRFALASLADLPGRIDYFLSRPIREEIAFIGFRDLIKWPVMLAIMLALGAGAGYVQWRAGRRVLAVVAVLAIPAALLWCNAIFFMMKKGNWPYRVHLPTVMALVLISILHLKVIAASFRMREILISLPLLAASLGIVLFAKFVVVQDVHRSDLVELRLIRKFAASIGEEYDAVHIETPRWNVKRARYMLYEDVGIPSLIAPWAATSMFQLAHVKEHGEPFGGRVVLISPENPMTADPRSCLFRSNEILRKHRTLASVRKYVPTCD
jgi:hypothetical protein